VTFAELTSTTGVQLLKSLLIYLLKLHRIELNVDACSSYQEVYQLLASTDKSDIRPYFTLGDDQTANNLKLLHFIATLLQGMHLRITRVLTNSSTQSLAHFR